jgi:hypothetical protein
MNLHSFAIQTMKETDPASKHYKAIATELAKIIEGLDDLLENPIFIDNIDGEQEINLDRALELLFQMRERFVPDAPAPDFDPAFESESFDAE